MEYGYLVYIYVYDVNERGVLDVLVKVKSINWFNIMG